VGDLALDTNGKYIYATDIGNHRAQKFDYDGRLLSSWGAFGKGDGQFDRPAGLALDSSGIIFVADTNNNRIQKFDKNGSYIGKWGTYGAAEGQFDNPVSIIVDPVSDNLYVTHGGSTKIQVFDKTGKFVNGWGTTGAGDGQFKRAVGLAFGDDDKVYVADKEKSEISIFTIDYSTQPTEGKTTTK
jgi:tripartite motif-containing protein 71